MNRNNGRPVLALAFILAGTSPVAGRLLAGELEPFTLAAAGLGLLLAAALPLRARAFLHTARRLRAADWRMLVMQALLGIVLFRALLFLGLQSTGAAEAGILTGAAPAITALLAWLFLREQLTARRIVGIAAAAAGIALLQGAGLQPGGISLQHLAGNAFVLAAAASEATFNILARKYGAGSLEGLRPGIQALLVAAMAFLLCLLPASLEHPVRSLQVLGAEEWAALAWYGWIVTWLSFTLFYAGVRRCDAYTVAAFSGLLPLTSMILSALLLGERVNVYQWTGGAVVMAGIGMLGALPGTRQSRPR
ncbi:DMT family transporter [Paenibacillus spiritus]|uniref:DMT family transporter n=1 Tax=Paenibacillus spiritus TaxID=2496557 RepID=A0A5J5GAG3_9BACL|nr:DMT family transporter [Paenibacillus spiritus]KAA9004105.1 DMT family transporter [Paenibacillus spiritus]